VFDGARENAIVASVVSGNANDGVSIRGAGTDENRVEDSRVGTDLSGAVDLGNDHNGIEVRDGAEDTRILDNVISGNGRNGIWVHGDDTDTTGIRGNTIGLDEPRGARLENERIGIWIEDRPERTTVGGVNPADRNVISGNRMNGIRIEDAPRTEVAGNLVGLDGAGLAKIENGNSGIWILDGSELCVVGDAANPAGRNVISGNAGQGIRIADSKAVKVLRNVIGLDEPGMAAIANQGSGVVVEGRSPLATIGAPGAGNVISGNRERGVLLSGPDVVNATIEANLVGIAGGIALARGNELGGVQVNGARSTTIRKNAASGNGRAGGAAVPGIGLARAEGVEVLGNRVGLDEPGLTPYPNAGPGILIDAGSRRVTLDAGNLVSANLGPGIRIVGDGNPMTVRILSSTIGLDATGGVQGNDLDGILVEGTARGVEVGTAGNGNVIAGNTGDGIRVRNAGTAGVSIRGNRIGTDRGGARAPNETGVHVEDGAQNVAIGGAAPGEANLIQFNRQEGVRIEGAATGQVQLRRNAIFDNGALGIDLGPAGTDANDAGDVDGGPNGMMNRPSFCVSTDPATGNPALSGSVDTPNPAAVAVEIFVNARLDPSGNGEGQRFLGVVAPNAAGEFTIPDLTAAPWNLAAGALITATATDAGGNTSEFGTGVGFDLVDQAFAPLRSASIGLVELGHDTTGLPVVGGIQLAFMRNGAPPNHFIDRDPRRFHAQVIDGALNANPAAAERHAGLVSIGTELANGAVLDPLHTVRVDESAANSTTFRSPSQLLAGDALEDGAVAQDALGGLAGPPSFYGAPFRANDGLGNHPADEAADDRTHEAEIGGAVVATYRAPGGHLCRVSRPVCQPGTIRTLIVITHNFNEPYDDIGYVAAPGGAIVGRGNGRFDFLDANGNGVHDANERREPFLDLSAGGAIPFPAGNGRRSTIWDPAQVANQVARAGERWRQACIRIVVAGALVHDPPPGLWLDATHDDQSFGPLSGDDQAIQRGFRTPSNLDGIAANDFLDVYFLPPPASAGINAMAYRPGYVATLAGVPSTFANQVQIYQTALGNANAFTLAHEIGHQLTDSGHPAGVVYPQWEIFPTTPGSGSRYMDDYRRMSRATVTSARTTRLGSILR
jgi:hypothetical protein